VEMNRLRQRLISLISAVVFLGFLYVLFKKLIIVTWIPVPWWGALLVLVVVFFMIQTFVARTLGGKPPAQRALDKSKEAAGNVASTAAKIGDGAVSAGTDALENVKRKLAEHDKRAE
jgi:protein-S-isoprenylcysteine O-methyltransferase Ste14